MQESQVSSDDLRLVLALARGGSLSGAAAALGVDHSTAYRRLNALERRLGVRVAERRREGYVLTAAGTEMLAAAEQVADTLAGLERKLAGRDLQLEGSVRLTAPDDMAVALLSPMLARFQAAYPAIHLEVVTDNRMLSLTRREADIAVRPSRQPPEDLVGRRIGVLAGGIYAAPGLAAAHAGANDLAALCDSAWIGFEDSGRATVYGRFTYETIPPDRLVQRSNSLLMQAAAAREGAGLVALPCFLGDDDPGLARVLGPLDALTSALWLLTHRDLQRTARIRALLDFLHGELRATRARLAGDHSTARRSAGSLS